MATQSVEDLLKRKKAIEQSLSKMQEQQAVAEANMERIKNELTSALVELKDKFGVSSFDEAKDKFETMKASLEKTIEEAEEQLREVRSK